MKLVEIVSIRIDGKTQQRSSINEEHVGDLEKALKAGDKLEPVRLIFDGSEHWMVDGFHRYHAHKRRGLKMIPAEVTNGTAEDARRESYRAWNAVHGLKESQKDKERRIKHAVADPILADWTDNKLAALLSVDHKTVAKYRKPETAKPKPKAKKGKEVSAGSEKVGNSQLLADGENAGNSQACAQTTVNATVADAVSTPPSEPAPAAPPQPPVQPAKPPTDQNDAPLPDIKTVRDAFAARGDVSSVLNHLTQLTPLFKTLYASPAGPNIRPFEPRILAAVKEVRNLVTSYQPWALCGDCRGEGCDRCRKLGWLDKETSERRAKGEAARTGGK